MRKFFNRLRINVRLENKHILAIMTMLCVSLMVTAFSTSFSLASLRIVAGIFVVPFENSISSTGEWLSSVWDLFRDQQELLEENKALQEKVDILTQENNYLLQSQTDLNHLKELYSLEEDYADLPKVPARIIGKEAGNWYSTFTINKGSLDGIRVDHNVVSGKGLVGIVTEVGPNWATVESIINDTSNVSAQTVSTEANCIVQGDLELLDQGYLRFTQMNDPKDKVTIGERLVTSHISEKYVEGLFIGYIAEEYQDSNNLTKTGTVVTPVDFNNLRYVYVITMSKTEQLAKQAEEQEKSKEEEAEKDSEEDSGEETGEKEEAKEE